MTEHKGSHHGIWAALSELRDQIRLLQAQIQLLEEVQKSLVKRARRLEDGWRELER